MATGRNIRGALANFLNTFTSRYSDYSGYWLFGFLVGDSVHLRVNLLEPSPPRADSPVAAAYHLASAKFLDQLTKAGMEPSQVREAQLSIETVQVPADGLVNGHPCSGYHARFAVEAILKGGRRYQTDRILFVAPHNPAAEYRSARVP